MLRSSRALAFAASVVIVMCAAALPASADPKPAAVNATIVNGKSNPIPVVIQGQATQETITFRDGFQVPAGKQLLIDDVSVSCTTVGTNLTDFRTFGLAVSMLLHITYPPADCPEPLDSEGECHQLFSVGTGRQTGIEPIFLMPPPDSRPAARLWAGRQLTAIADQRATLFGQCDGIQVNFPPGFNFTMRGTGRLVDRP